MKVALFCIFYSYWQQCVFNSFALLAIFFITFPYGPEYPIFSGPECHYVNLSTRKFRTCISSGP